MSPNAKVTSGITYYAHWTKKKWTVTFDVNGGSSISESERTITVMHEDFIGTLPVTTREGYSLTWKWGDSIVEENTQVTSNMSVIAIWTINEYNVTFDANGGTGGTNEKQEYGTTIVPPTVERTGYTFKGWSPNVATTVPAHDVTYTAQWMINQYTVTFDMNCELPTQTASRTHDSYLNPPVVNRVGWTVEGWYTEREGGEKLETTTKITQDLTCYAQWEVAQYYVTYHANGGTFGDGQNTTRISHIYGENIKQPGTPPTPKSELGNQVVFDNWYTLSDGGTPIDSNIQVTKSMSYYARWIRVLRYGLAISVQHDSNMVDDNGIISGFRENNGNKNDYVYISAATGHSI